MRHFQFSLRWLLGATAFVALGCTALMHPYYWVTPVWNATLGAIAATIVMAILTRGTLQAFCVGFAVFAGGYLWLVHDAPGNRFASNWHERWRFQKEGPLFTTNALYWMWEYRDALRPPSERKPSDLKVIVGLRVNSQWWPGLEAEAFMLIGQSLWALLLGAVGGWFGRFLLPGGRQQTYASRSTAAGS